MFAQVENGFVTAVSKTEIDGYILCGDAVSIDWSYSSGNFYYPTRSSPPHRTPQQVLSSQAQFALNKSDVTVIRCLSVNVQVPTEWIDYRVALRNIINGSDVASTELPATPTFPSGT